MDKDIKIKSTNINTMWKHKANLKIRETKLKFYKTMAVPKLLYPWN